MMLGRDHPLWKILQDLISYIPAVIVMILITNKWDGEYLVLVALLAGAGGKTILENLRQLKDKTDG